MTRKGLVRWSIVFLVSIPVLYTCLYAWLYVCSQYDLRTVEAHDFPDFDACSGVPLTAKHYKEPSGNLRPYTVIWIPSDTDCAISNVQFYARSCSHSHSAMVPYRGYSYINVNGDCYVSSHGPCASSPFMQFFMDASEIDENAFVSNLLAHGYSEH